MSQYETILAALQRPRTLIRAARHGATRYRRDRDLTLFKGQARPGSAQAIVQSLLERESDLEFTRRSGSAEYSVTQHVSVLTALIAEVRAVTSSVPG